MSTTGPSMTSLAKDYLDYRKQLGFGLSTVGQLLMQFAEYADETGHRETVTTELAVRWAALAKNASGSHRACRLNVVRGFAKYRALFDPKTEIPPPGVFGPPYRRRTPYIFSCSEVAALLKAAQHLPPEGSLRPHTFSTFFGLLACTGLRHREARRLTRDDVDFKSRLLRIRETKFRKSRLVPLHDSTLTALASYARVRDEFPSSARTDAFFVTLRGTPLSTSAAHWAFSRVREQLTWQDIGEGRRPRIHDFRHTFACRRLREWYEQGVDVNHAIVGLATYLGHADVNDTYWYLSATPELLELAGSRFEQFAKSNSGDAP
ncbi:MAG: integrase [Planctomycetes bacterium]|nr:integrase [Planctomycetota bacterium]